MLPEDALRQLTQTADVTANERPGPSGSRSVRGRSGLGPTRGGRAYPS